MSSINGDKSRFHRTRKQNIQRRARTREMLKALGRAPQAAAVPVAKRKGSNE
jgi:hypothetical protein